MRDDALPHRTYGAVWFDAQHAESNRQIRDAKVLCAHAVGSKLFHHREALAGRL